MSVAATDYSSLISKLNGSAGAGASSTSASATQEMGERFLKLLVTQLQNQDPMNPMENAELTMQLAQMSTVEGITKMNTTLESLATQFRANQVLQGSALVGRQVMAEGNALTLTSAGAAGGFDLDKGASQVNVQVFNQAGTLVEEIELGKLDAGFHRFVWDGLNTQGALQAQGDYTYKVDAKAGQNAVTATPYALGSVLSVALEADGMNLEVAGLGMRGMDQIKQVF